MMTPALGTAGTADTPAAGSTAALVDAGAGAEARKQRRHTVATFISAFTDPPGWSAAPLSAQLS